MRVGVVTMKRVHRALVAALVALGLVVSAVGVAQGESLAHDPVLTGAPVVLAQQQAVTYHDIFVDGSSPFGGGMVNSVGQYRIYGPGTWALSIQNVNFGPRSCAFWFELDITGTQWVYTNKVIQNNSYVGTIWWDVKPLYRGTYLLMFRSVRNIDNACPY